MAHQLAQSSRKAFAAPATFTSQVTQTVRLLPTRGEIELFEDTLDD